MSSFTTPLDTRYIDGRKWRVLGEFCYHIGCEDSKDFVRVPDGFITDFASVPRVFWRIIPPTGLYGKAAVIHDHMYLVGARSRKECDLIFLEAMKVLGVSYWKRHVMYRAVRMFGWKIWNKYRKAERG